MKKLTTINIHQAPGQTYGEACWAALTPEWRAWVEDAGDDWIEMQIRYHLTRSSDRLAAEDDILSTALINEAKRRGLR